jgi:hypothetical protein
MRFAATKAAMVAAHDPDHPRLPAGQRLQRGAERIAPLIDLTPGQRADLVDESGPVRASLRGRGEPRYGRDVLASHGRGDPQIFVGPQRRDHA